jgi:hypothetical protein
MDYGAKAVGWKEVPQLCLWVFASLRETPVEVWGTHFALPIFRQELIYFESWSNGN